MKNIIFCLIFCIFSISVAYAAQKVEIYTYDTLPPFAFRDEKGNLTGVYIEIVKKAVSQMPAYSVSFKVVPWARAKKAVELGKAFAILPPYFHAHDWLTETEPHRPYIWPYSLPLFTQHDVVICNKDVLTVRRKIFPDDYAGLRFVMWRGDGRAGMEFAKMVKDNAISLHELNSIKDTIPYLLINRADCTVTDQTSFEWFAKKVNASGEYKDTNAILKQNSIISSNEGYLGYTDIEAEKNFPFKKDFAIKFDIEIYKMRKNGDIQKIVDRFVK